MKGKNKGLGKSWTDLIFMAVIIYPLLYIFLGLLWLFFFKDSQGNFLEVIPTGTKNIALFMGKIITAAIILIPADHLMIYAEDKFKLTKNQTHLLSILKILIKMFILSASIYFDLNLFSKIIDTTFNF